MYEGYKIYGPYQREDGRQHVCLVSLVDGKRKTLSYSKYLLECHLGRYLTEDETVDHIDCNPSNNEIENLRVLARTAHVREDVRRLCPQEFICPSCEMGFKLEGSKLSKAKSNRRANKAGPFCSKQCAGIYSQKVQSGQIERLRTSEIVVNYTSLKFERSVSNNGNESGENGETLTDRADGNTVPSFSVSEKKV